MISHIIEYQCQYTDQVRKKNKIWHDGRLKYFQINNRFQLFTEEDNVLLGSSFITNQKEVDVILDEEGFNKVEHKIFGQYMVVISEITNEYDREVNVSAAGSRDSKISTQRNNCANYKSYTPKRQIVSNTTTKGTADSGGSSLALKFNTPFRKPRMIGSQSEDLKAAHTNINRPNIRSKVDRRDTDKIDYSLPNKNVSSNKPIKTSGNIRKVIPDKPLNIGHKKAECIDNEIKDNRLDSLEIRKVVSNATSPLYEETIGRENKQNIASEIQNKSASKVKIANKSISPEPKSISPIPTNNDQVTESLVNSDNAEKLNSNKDNKISKAKRAPRRKIRVIDHQPIII
ncbi:hypothetical protein Kpol_472p18 [Vanderwaltozyma polyspora DSM 70294]|uniref:5'-3' DNA helicase ZGRF1-like N-terminal domain-containing protein n=1 Tax=Vanderwaltozyma polyspora (strain ATCC 22028 / DSM 70294 / BCRC 21397 / CBS 2163 / NBRC 10782 / NRRL Y-8283 / UCD 57-17) TaxID=436907 RepID=A7TQI6_VANPO|nr:uncharacterized protein Kpol_472p18 [Vanderwaltozyma polyspora DSM 70294]EDO15487.1 hypothetical protein Kpol_472p18 [Vanderwaltozyma polyspora DSM 70294]